MAKERISPKNQKQGKQKQFFDTKENSTNSGEENIEFIN